MKYDVKETIRIFLKSLTFHLACKGYNVSDAIAKAERLTLIQIEESLSCQHSSGENDVQ